MMKVITKIINKNRTIASTMFLLTVLLWNCGKDDDDGVLIYNPAGVQNIFTVNTTYTWLREPLIMRLPDGSLFCEIFTGGSHDGHRGNVVAAVRSNNDGQTWSNIEVIKSLPDTACWASAVFANNDRGYIFWYTMPKGRRNMNNEDCRLLYTGPDKRTFTGQRLLADIWKSGQFMDIRRGIELRNGKFIMPCMWKETDNFGHTRTHIGAIEPNSDFSSFNLLGSIYQGTTPFLENQIAELSDGTLVMLSRVDLTNVLWSCRSSDGGKTWSAPVRTTIKNPGSKFLLINLPDGRIVLFNNPSERPSTDTSNGHKYRTPLEMWVSNDDMKTWSYKETIAQASDGIAMYPDGFYDAGTNSIYLVWENERTVFFKKIPVKNW